ncbi:MAG: hypothetical protein A2017_17030 [Lentisphaerae bacterium GWF2_44_16]|nr:MAG: hypothetical protein A2017_17030 [Lentisphaerae bacterium GWF2_44_16]
MSRFVNVATVLFSTCAERGKKDAKDILLRETKAVLESMKGYGFDLVVFSEGVEAFGQTVDEAEELKNPGPFLKMYMEFAASEKCHVAGSIKIAENGKAHNSIAFIDAEGKALGAYHKNNLTAGEIEMGLNSGGKAVTVDTAIGRIGGIICFDLNFEDIRKQYMKLKPDIMAFASMYHGGLMQAQWAYQCRSFFVSALPFTGGGILDPFGRALALTDCYTSIASARINLDRVMVHLDYNREKFPEIRRKYKGDVIVDIPPNIGPALIYSMTDKRSAMDVVREFGLELMDDYMERSITANKNNR